MKYLAQALFIYDEQSEHLIEQLKNNEFNSAITAVEKNVFLNDPLEYIVLASHLIVSGSMQLINQLLEFSFRHSANGQQCSLAFLPLESQSLLSRAYCLSDSVEDNIEIALRDDTKAINLLECNGRLFQFKAVIGRIPLLESLRYDSSPAAYIKNILLGIKQFFRLSMNKISIETERGKQVNSVASGAFIINQHRKSHLQGNLLHNSSMRSDKLLLVVISPYSVIEYFLFLLSLISHINKENTLPHGVSNIQSSQIQLNFEALDAEVPRVKLDEINSTTFPLHIQVIKNAVKINAAEEFWELNPVSASDKEVIRTDNLPDEKERLKYLNQSVPFFSFASEDRFKDLFLQLRSDAKIDSLYIVLMLLSTLLALLGLFANSVAVVIGAMLLAPLMSPIISNSMGLLRGDEKLISQSMKKIALGVTLTLLASSILTLLLPQTELSHEIKARIHPNLLDLGVAVFSGIAAAYSKSHRELLNNLAGVAIAVALVPPLATAGIGLGRGELYIFEGALLLFVTNLFGITVAAVLTFQFLGFSNTVKSKKRVVLIFTILALLSYPLYRSFTDSLQRFRLTESLLDERIVINEKPVIIETALVEYQNNKRIINITMVLKKALNEEELQRLKEKLNQRFSSEYETRISIKYIL